MDFQKLVDSVCFVMFESLDHFDFKHINSSNRKIILVIQTCFLICLSVRVLQGWFVHSVLVTFIGPVLYNMSLYFGSSMCLITVSLTLRTLFSALIIITIIINCAFMAMTEVPAGWIEWVVFSVLVWKK